MQRTAFLFITRYKDDIVEIYKEGTEIQSLYFWRTTDELNVSRLVLQNTNRPVKMHFRTADNGLPIMEHKLGTWD